MPSYKLRYWNGRNRGELPRLTFAAAGVEFEEDVLERKDWPTIKPTTPFGKIPVLVVDGKELGDNGAITRYLADQFGLAGVSPWENALVDSVIQASNDLMDHTVFICYAKDAEKVRSQQRSMMHALLFGLFYYPPFHKFFTHMEQFIGRHGKNGHAVGEKLTVADLAIFNIIDQAESFYFPEVVDKARSFPKVKTVHDMVHSQEKIQAHLQRRPNATF